MTARVYETPSLTIPRNDPDFIAFVKEHLSSSISEWPAEVAHHIKGHKLGGTALKGPDFFTMPLTNIEHAEFHAAGMTPKKWESEYGSQWQHVAYALARYIIHLRHGS